MTGLQSQASVRYRGVRVGRVLSIALDRATPGNVLIRIAVDQDTPVTLTTFASLGFQGVTGLAFIQLDDSVPMGAALRGMKTTRRAFPCAPA